MKAMPSATAAASGNAVLTTAAAQPNGVSTRMRPATHRAASAASRQPVGVGWFDQFRPAVNRKPTTTASVKPNSISCACHIGPARYGRGSQPENCKAHRPIDSAANVLASEIERTKPECPQGEGSGLCARRLFELDG